MATVRIPDQMTNQPRRDGGMRPSWRPSMFAHLRPSQYRVTEVGQRWIGLRDQGWGISWPM